MMQTPSFKDRLFALLMILLPHHLISRLVYWLTRLTGPLVIPAIKTFIRFYRVDMTEALQPEPRAYPTFNQFFVRALQPESRPIEDATGNLVSPVDGRVSQSGNVISSLILQAKGEQYSLESLLGGDKDTAKLFDQGSFATIYLAPYNYHRIHMPVDGQLSKMIHVPGRLFSVAPWTVRAIPNLFTRNERVICLFETSQGPLAMILVGAINVAAIETVWHGLITPPKANHVSSWEYPETTVSLKKGEEMGRFNMGSTVILLTGQQIAWNESCQETNPLLMGQAIGEYTKPVS